MSEWAAAISWVVLAVAYCFSTWTTTSWLKRLDARVRQLETSALHRAVRDYIAAKRGAS